MYIKHFFKTAQISWQTQTNGGLLYSFPDYLMKVIYLLPLLFIWRTLIASGVPTDMDLDQLTSYTYVNALLTDFLVVSTFLTSWNYDSQSTNLFTVPIPIFAHIIARSLGKWLPNLLLFSLPMMLTAPFWGVKIIPITPWFWLSLLLCTSLGFAIEIAFFCLNTYLRNVSWLVYVIRGAIVSFFSGTIIPFNMLPSELQQWISFQPFGSLGGAPLSLFVGSASPNNIIPVQVFWNIVIWLLVTVWFNKVRERIVSFGG